MASTSIPPQIFDREFTQITIRQLFAKDNEGNYEIFNALDSRGNCNKKYRIPGHQRYYKNWNQEGKEDLIDSVYKGYIIGGISVSRHIEDLTRFYFNIEDAQSRLTIFQEYLDDKVEYRGKTFSERTEQEKNRFLNYAFHIEEVTPLTSARRDNETTIDDHYYEQFDRINRGIALEDNDKYWCKKSKPMVKLAIELIQKMKDDEGSRFMGCKNWLKMTKHKENRSVLEKICTLIGALLYDVYKKSYSRHYTNIGKGISNEQKLKVYDFINFYKSIHDAIYQNIPLANGIKEKILPFNNPGKFLGMIVRDYKESRENISNNDKINMWVNILNIHRKSDNFMKGTQTLYTGFTGADKGNQEISNIDKRLERIISFYDDKSTITQAHQIEYNEPEPGAESESESEYLSE